MTISRAILEKETENLADEGVMAANAPESTFEKEFGIVSRRYTKRLVLSFVAIQCLAILGALFDVLLH